MNAEPGNPITPLAADPPPPDPPQPDEDTKGDLKEPVKSPKKD